MYAAILASGKWKLISNTYSNFVFLVPIHGSIQTLPFFFLFFVWRMGEVSLSQTFILVEALEGSWCSCMHAFCAICSKLPYLICFPIYMLCAFMCLWRLLLFIFLDCCPVCCSWESPDEDPWVKTHRNTHNSFWDLEPFLVMKKVLLFCAKYVFTVAFILLLS